PPAARRGRPGGTRLPGCSSAGAIIGTGKRLGPDHIGVSRVGRKHLMPGRLAPNPRPVDTDLRHFSHLLGQPPIRGDKRGWPRPLVNRPSGAVYGATPPSLRTVLRRTIPAPAP